MFYERYYHKVGERCILNNIHVTLVLLVLAVLTVLCAQEQAGPPVSAQEMAHQVTPSPIPLTVPEVRRLLGRLLFPLPRSAMAVLAWSWWRRCQQGTRLAHKTAPELELVVRWFVLSDPSHSQVVC